MKPGLEMAGGVGGCCAPATRSASGTSGTARCLANGVAPNRDGTGNNFNISSLGFFVWFLSTYRVVPTLTEFG